MWGGGVEKNEIALDAARAAGWEKIK